MEHENGIIKKSEMDNKTTYILCPQSGCELFFAERRIPCEHDCPFESSLIKIIKCLGCGNTIELPGDHRSIYRVDHDEPGGCNSGMFQRMSGRYRLIYERPTD
jgi:hypothetical protein